ncbi:hypothetical protein TGCAST_233960 [Toxoplasma gondii CAST]|uniref:Uncharacterized protein n=1 Tax=Toxoplasma gondii CAST TaxID=943122 RepID=A0A3R7ZEH9_TOXGO|nr:hypothetical protein TGCAST_233960 [Toxoplasma gondii CAST]
MPLDRRGLSHQPSSSEEDVSHLPCLAHRIRASYIAPVTRVFLDPGVYPQPSRASPCSHFLRCFRLHYPVVRFHLLAALECSDSHLSPRIRTGVEDHASSPLDSIRENAVGQSALELQLGHHYHGNYSLPLPQAELDERLKTQSASPLGYRECLHAKASITPQPDRTNDDDPEILRALAAKDCSGSPVCVRCAAKHTGDSLFFPGSESANAPSHSVNRSFVPQGREDPCPDTFVAFDQLALAVLKRLRRHATTAVENILNTSRCMHVRQASRTRLKRENPHNFACLRSTTGERIFHKREPTNQETSERPQKRKKREQGTALATADTTKTEEGIPVVEERKDAETDVTAENPIVVCRPSRPASPICSAQENLPVAYLLRKKRIKTTVARVSTSIHLTNGASPQQSSTCRRQNPCLGICTGRKLERVETETVSNSADGRNDREMEAPLSVADANAAEKENKLRVESAMRSTPVSYRSYSSPYEAGDIEEVIPEISFSSSENEFLACSIDSPSSLDSSSTSSSSSASPCIFSEPCSPLFSSSPLSSAPVHQKPCFSPPTSSSSASLCLTERSPSPVVSLKNSLDLPPSASMRQVQTACTCLSACLSSDSLSSERPLASGRSSLIAAVRFALRLLFNSDRYPPDFFSGASHSVARLALHLTFLAKRMQQLRPRVSCGSSTTEAPLISALAGSVARPERGEQRLWRKRVVEKRRETQRQRTRKNVRGRGKSAFCDGCQRSVQQKKTIPETGDAYGRRRKADEHTEDRQRNGTYTQWLKEASGGVKRPRALINGNKATPHFTSAMNSQIEEERLRKKQEALRARKTNFSLAVKLQCLKTTQRQSRPSGRKTARRHQMRLYPHSSYSFYPTSCSLVPSYAAVCASSPVSIRHLPPTRSSSRRGRITAAAVSPQRPKKNQQHVPVSHSYPRTFASVFPQSPSAVSEGCRAYLSAPDIAGVGGGAPVSPDVHTLAEGSPRFRTHVETLGEAAVDTFLERHDRFRLGRLTPEERALLRLLIQSKRLICLLLRALLSPSSFSEQGPSHADTPSQCSSTSPSSFKFQQNARDALSDAELPSSFLVLSCSVAPRRQFRDRLPLRSPSSSSLPSSPLPSFSFSSPSPRSPPCPPPPPPCSPSSSVSSPSSSTVSSSSSPSSSSSASLESGESAQRARESRLPSAVFGGPQTLIQALQMYFAYRPGAGRHLLGLLPACIVAEEDRVVFQPLSWRGEENDTSRLSPREQATRRKSNRHDVEVASGDSDRRSREKQADKRNKKCDEKKRRGTKVKRESEKKEEDEGDSDGKEESGEGSERGAGWRGAGLALKEADEGEGKRRKKGSIASEMRDQATVPNLDGTHTVETRDITSQERRTDVEREMRDTDTQIRTVFDFVYSSQATRTEVSLLLNRPKPEDVSSASSLSPSPSRCSRSSVSPDSTPVSPASETSMRLPENAFAVLCGFLCGDLLPLLQTCRYLRSAVLSTFGTCQQQLNLLMVDVDDTRFPFCSPVPTPLSPASPAASFPPVSRDVWRPPPASFASFPSFSSFRFTHLAQAFKKDKAQLLYLLTFWRGAVEAWVEPRQLAELLECMDSLENIRELSLFSDERMHVFFSQEDPESVSVFEEALDLSEEDRESRRERPRPERQDGKKKDNPFLHLKLRRKKQRSPNTIDVDASEEGEGRRDREDVRVRRRRQSNWEEKGIRTESEKTTLAFSSADTQATKSLQAGAPFAGVFENSSAPSSASVSSLSSSLPVASPSHPRCARPSSSSFSRSSACGPLYGQQAVEACLSTLVSLCARSSRTLEAFYSSVKLLNFLSLSAVARLPVLLLPRLVTVEGGPATVPPFVSSSLRFVSLCGTETLRADPLERSRSAMAPPTAVCGRAGPPGAGGACGDWRAPPAADRDRFARLRLHDRNGERKHEGEEERRGGEQGGKQRKAEQEGEQEGGHRRKEEQGEDERGEGERGADRDKDLGEEFQGARDEAVESEASVSRNVERKAKIASSRRSDTKSASDAELHREVEEASQEAGTERAGASAFPFQGGTDVSCWSVHEPYLCLSIWRSQPTVTTVLCEGLTLRVPDSECARWDLSLRHPPARSEEKLGNERDRTTLPGKATGSWKAQDGKLERDGEREWRQDTVKAMHATQSEEPYTLSLPYPFPSSDESKTPRVVRRSGGLRSRSGRLIPEPKCMDFPWSLVHAKTPSRSFLTRSQSPSSSTKTLASWAPSLSRWAPNASSGAPNLSPGATELAGGSRVFSLPSLSRLRLRAVSQCSLISPKLEAAAFAIEGRVCLVSPARRAHNGARSRGGGGAFGPVVLELLGAVANNRCSTNSFFWGSVEPEMETPEETQNDRTQDQETRDEETHDEETQAVEPHKETYGKEIRTATQGEASLATVGFDALPREVEVAGDRIGERGVARVAQRSARQLLDGRRVIRAGQKRDDASRTPEKKPHRSKLETRASSGHNFQGWSAGRKQLRYCVCHSRSVGESPSLDFLECTGSRLVLASSSSSSWSNMAGVSLQLPLCLLHVACSLFDATVTSTERVAAVLVAPVDGDSGAFTGATLRKFSFREEPKGTARKSTRLEIADSESLTGDRIGLRTLARARNTSDREQETETEEGEEEEEEGEEEEEEKGEEEEEEKGEDEEEEEEEKEGTREARERGGKGGGREQWVVSGELEPQEKQSRIRAFGRLLRGVSWKRRTSARRRSPGDPPKRTGEEKSGEEAPGRSTRLRRKTKEAMHRGESVEGKHRSCATPEWEYIIFKGSIATGGLPCLRCRACKGERQRHRCMYREKLLPQDIVDLLSSAAASCSFQDIHLDSLMWCTYPPLCSRSSVASDFSCPSSRRGSSVLPASSRLMTVRELRRRPFHVSLSPSELSSPDGSFFHSPAVSVSLSPSSASLLASPPSAAESAPCSRARHNAPRCPPASGFLASSSPSPCGASPASSPASPPSGNTVFSPSLSPNSPSSSSVSSSAAPLSPHLFSLEASAAPFSSLAVGCRDTPVHAQHSRAVSTSLFPIARDTSFSLNVPREVPADAAAENATTCICALSFDPFPSYSGRPEIPTPRRVDEALAGSSSSSSVSSTSPLSLVWHLTRPESSHHDAELARARHICAQYWRRFWREVEKRLRQTHRVQCHRTGVATVSADCMRLRQR